MGHLGFSYVGLLYLLMLFIPNLFWTRYQPSDYVFQNENRFLLFLERTGQICVTCCALIFSDFNLVPFSPWSLWLIASFSLILFYEAYWLRYFWGAHTLENFYRSFCGIPVPGATLPVLSFFLLGIYGKVIWMLLSVILLGIGHIGIHLQHFKTLR